MQITIPSMCKLRGQIICFSLFVLCTGHGLHIRGTDPHAHSMALHQKRNSRSKESVYLVEEMLDQIKQQANKYTQDGYNIVEKRHDSETLRLTAAEQIASTQAEKGFLQDTIKFNEQDRVEMRSATSSLLSFYYTLNAGLGAQSGAPSCQYLQCGDNAVCVQHGSGAAFCQCKTCFEGNGFVCKPSSCTPARFSTAMNLLSGADLSWEPRMAEVHVQAFSNNFLAIAYRDLAEGNRGFLLLGHASDADFHWGKLQPFSDQKQAYGPVIVVMDSGRFIIAFRDENRAGIGFLTAGHVDTANDLQAVLSPPQAFARQVAQHMVLLPMPTSRVVCLYAEEILNAEGNLASGFGGALVVEVSANNVIHILGKKRFAEKPVARLAATRLTPSSFVVGFRSVPVIQNHEAESEELSAMWMELSGSELVIDPHPLKLEPKGSDMWARDLALVSESLFAYSYQSGGEEKTKQTIIRVDPVSHHMTVVSGPEVIGSGPTPFVQSISMPYGAGAPHTFTYFRTPALSSVAEVCRVSPEGHTSGCRQVKWADTQTTVVSAAKLRDGRLAFVFGNSEGVPMYQILGAPASGA